MDTLVRECSAVLLGTFSNVVCLVFQRHARLRQISCSNNPCKQSGIHVAAPILSFFMTALDRAIISASMSSIY